jgi:hypothetical protein
MACSGVTAPQADARTAPDWNLKGDLIAARFFRDIHLMEFLYVTLRRG